MRNSTLHPAVVYVQGGGFRLNEKAPPHDANVSPYSISQWFDPREAALRGVAGVTCDFRNIYDDPPWPLAPELRTMVPDYQSQYGNMSELANTIFASVIDLRKMIRFVRSRAEEFGIDKNRITLAGYSSGAVTIAAHLLAVHDLRADIAGADVSHPSESHEVLNAVIWAGGIFTIPLEAFGINFLNRGNTELSLSPPQTPPNFVLIVQGTDDEHYPVNFAEQNEELFLSMGIPARLHLNGVRHYSPQTWMYKIMYDLIGNVATGAYEPPELMRYYDTGRPVMFFQAMGSVRNTSASVDLRYGQTAAQLTGSVPPLAYPSIL